MLLQKSKGWGNFQLPASRDPPERGVGKIKVYKFEEGGIPEKVKDKGRGISGETGASRSLLDIAYWRLL